MHARVRVSTLRTQAYARTLDHGHGGVYHRRVSTKASHHLRSALRLLNVPREGDSEGQVGFRARKPDVLRRQMESAAREIHAALVAGDAGLRSLADAVVDEFEEAVRSTKPIDRGESVRIRSEPLETLRDALSVGKRPKSS